MLEDLSMGMISRLYKGLAQDSDRKAIAKRFSVPQKVLGSWLHTLTFVRNICAHHARLWNRELAVPPSLPEQPDWQLPANDGHMPNPKYRVYIVLAILAHLMRHISPDSQWRERLIQLIAENNFISLAAMGFPANWRTLAQWQDAQL
jgi:abortive infection bacteriophage resistance protein